MKVLQIYRTYFPDTQGGAEEAIRQLTVGLQELDVECRILVPSRNPNPKEVQVAGVTVIRVKMHLEIASCGFAFTSLDEFRRQVEWADIVHYHFPWPFADMLDVIGRVSKPKVITYHSDIVRQKGLMSLYQPLMQRFLSNADTVVATSPQYVETSAVLNKLDNVSVIPLGVAQESYPEPSLSTLKATKDEFGSGYFLFVGMLRYYKGLHILLDAVESTDLNVVIAGAGPEESDLHDRVAKGNFKNVRFAGRVSDEQKVALIDQSLGLVFPSHLRSEAFGVSLVEGLMRGKPLISADIGTGTSFVNLHETTGLVVEAGNASELQVAMKHLRDEPGRAHEFGCNAKERYEQLFRAELMAESYRKLYQSLL